MSKWLDLKINVEIQVSPITDNEKETKYKLDLTISAIIVLSVSKLVFPTSCKVDIHPRSKGSCDQLMWVVESTLN